MVYESFNVYRHSSNCGYHIEKVAKKSEFSSLMLLIHLALAYFLSFLDLDT